MAVNRYYSSIAVDTTLTTGISSSDTQIVLASTQGYPTSYPFTLALDYDTSAEELVNVVGVGAVSNSYIVGTSVGTASVTGRGVDSTTAQSHSASAAVKHVISGRDMREAQEHIAASTNVHGITNTADLATKTGTETLTNKTLTAPAIAGGTIASATITAGSITGSVGGNPTFTGTVTLPTTTSIGAVSGTELAYVDGVTSAIQTQLDAKAPLASPTFTGTVTLPTGVTGATGAITNNMMAANSVSSSNIIDGTIVNADINASAAIAQSKIDGLSTSFAIAAPTGSIVMWATASPPTGWQLCDGGLAQSAALQTVLGTTNVPNMQGYAPVGWKSLDADFGTLKGTTGSKTVTLAKGNIPAHVHDMSHNHNIGTSDVNLWYNNAGGTANIASGSSTNREYKTFQDETGNTGNGVADGLKTSPDAVSLIQPSVVVNFIIKY